DVLKTEIAGMQTYQQRHPADPLVDGRALGRGIDGDLLAVTPIVLPPGMGQGGQQRTQAGYEKNQQALLHDQTLRKTSCLVALGDVLGPVQKLAVILKCNLGSC